MRILLVDDQPAFTALLADAMRYQGHIVATANSGEEALGLGPLFAPEAVVTDLRLAQELGTDVIRRLQGCVACKVFVLLTGDLGYAPPEELSDVPIVHKPCRVEELLSLVERLVRNCH